MLGSVLPLPELAAAVVTGLMSSVFSMDELSRDSLPIMFLAVGTSSIVRWLNAWNELMPLTDAGKDIAIDSVFLSRSLALGLRSGKDELAQPGYRRQAVLFDPPEAADRHISNSAEIVFVLSEPATVDGYLVADTLGAVLAEGKLDSPLRMGSNQEVVLRPGDVVVTLH